MTTFNMIILKVEGNTGVAAYGVIANISLVVVSIYTGIAQGVQPLISHFYGKNMDRQVRTLMRYSLQTMLVILLFMYNVLAEVVAMFFTPSLVLVSESLFDQLTDTFTMPENGHKIHSLLTAVSPAGLENKRFASGKAVSSREIKLSFNMVYTLEYCWYRR